MYGFLIFGQFSSLNLLIFNRLLRQTFRGMIYYIRTGTNGFATREVFPYLYKNNFKTALFYTFRARMRMGPILLSQLKLRKMQLFFLFYFKIIIENFPGFCPSFRELLLGFWRHQGESFRKIGAKIFFRIFFHIWHVFHLFSNILSTYSNIISHIYSSKVSIWSKILMSRRISFCSEILSLCSFRAGKIVWVWS